MVFFVLAGKYFDVLIINYENLLSKIAKHS